MTKAALRPVPSPQTVPASNTHDAIGQISKSVSSLLKNREDFIATRNNSEISIFPKPPNSLPVNIFVFDGKCTVALDNWYDDFSSLQLALPFIEDAIRGDLRLKVQVIRGKPRIWTVERLGQRDEWIEENSMSAFTLFGWWGHRDTYYLRNRPNRKSGRVQSSALRISQAQ